MDIKNEPRDTGDSTTVAEVSTGLVVGTVDGTGIVSHNHELGDGDNSELSAACSDEVAGSELMVSL